MNPINRVEQTYAGIRLACANLLERAPASHQEAATEKYSADRKSADLRGEAVRAYGLVGTTQPVGFLLLSDARLTITMVSRCVRLRISAQINEEKVRSNAFHEGGRALYATPTHQFLEFALSTEFPLPITPFKPDQAGRGRGVIQATGPIHCVGAFAAIFGSPAFGGRSSALVLEVQHG